MSAANGGTSGPAPQGDPQTTPQAGRANGGSPSTASQAPQAGGDHTQTQQQPSSGQLSASDYERIIGELRRENAGHRTGKAELEKQLKAFQDAQLTDAQKRERDFTDLQTKSAEMEQRLQRLTLENAGYRLGSALGIGDISAALALVQAEHAHEIKYAADGAPENISDLLKAVLKDHPVLAAQVQQQQQSRQQAPAASSGGATNPGRQAGNGGLTLEMIRAMPMRERIARMDEIRAWEKAQAATQTR